MKKKLPSFNPCPDHLIDSEFKYNETSYLMEEISRWRNTQAAVRLLLTTFTEAYNENSSHKDWYGREWMDQESEDQFPS